MDKGTKIIVKFIDFSSILATNILILGNLGPLAWFYVWKNQTTDGVSCITTNIGDYDGLVFF